MWPVIKSGTSLACILQCLSTLRNGAGFKKCSLPTEFMHLIIVSEARNRACASCKPSQCQSRQRHTSYKLRETVLQAADRFLVFLFRKRHQFNIGKANMEIRRQFSSPWFQYKRIYAVLIEDWPESFLNVILWVVCFFAFLSGCWQ